MNISNRIMIIFVAGAPYFIAILAQLIFAKYLPVDVLGSFALINVAFGFFLILTNWNADKYIISNRDITDEGITSAITFELINSILLFLILVTFFDHTLEDYLKNEVSIWLWIGFFVTFFYFPITRSRALLEKKLRYKSAHFPTLFANVIALILGLACLILDYGLWSMVIWKASIYLFDAVFLLLLSRKIPKIYISLAEIPSFLKYTLPIYLGAIIAFISTNIDKIVISVLLGPTELGFYWLCSSLSHIPVVIREILLRLSLPFISQKGSHADKLDVFRKLNALLQIFCVFVGIFVTYWSDVFFVLILNDQWSHVYQMFVILTYSALLKLLGGSSASLLFSGMKTRIAFDISLLTLIILSPIIYLCITLYGSIGAAIAVFLVSVIVNWYAFETAIKKFTGEGFWYYQKYFTLNLAVLSTALVLSVYVELSFSMKALGTVLSIAFAVFFAKIDTAVATWFEFANGEIKKRFYSK